MTVELDHIELKSETDKLLLNCISTSFSHDEFVVIAGKNGAGKSLLLRSILGLEKPDTGSINYLEGDKHLTNRAEQQKKLGLVLQEAEKQILCNIVREDLSVSLEMQGILATEHTAKIEALCKTIPITHLLHRNVATLSGGERRLAALATVIVCEPRILFLDEPFQSLDYPASVELLRCLLRIHRTGVGIVVVTHAYHSLLAHAHRVLIMEQGTLKIDSDTESCIPLFASYGLEAPYLAPAQMSLLLRKESGNDTDF